MVNFWKKITWIWALCKGLHRPCKTIPCTQGIAHFSLMTYGCMIGLLDIGHTHHDFQIVRMFRFSNLINRFDCHNTIVRHET